MCIFFLGKSRHFIIIITAATAHDHLLLADNFAVFNFQKHRARRRLASAIYEKVSRQLFKTDAMRRAIYHICCVGARRITPFQSRPKTPTK